MVSYKLIRESRELILQGLSAQQVADHLGIKKSTVYLYTKSERQQIKELKARRKVMRQLAMSV